MKVGLSLAAEIRRGFPARSRPRQVPVAPRVRPFRGGARINNSRPARRHMRHDAHLSPASGCGDGFQAVPGASAAAAASRFGNRLLGLCLRFGTRVGIVAGFMPAAASSGFFGVLRTVVGSGAIVVHLGLLTLGVCLMDGLKASSLQRNFDPSAVSVIPPAECPQTNPCRASHSRPLR